VRAVEDSRALKADLLLAGFVAKVLRESCAPQGLLLWPRLQIDESIATKIPSPEMELALALLLH
jgi:hypothetical protein